MELPLSIIVWDTPTVEPDNYETLGSGETHKLGNLIYATELGLGGVIHSTSDGRNTFVLNSGILVTIITGVKDVFTSHDKLLLGDLRNDTVNFRSWLFLKDAKRYSRRSKIKLSNALYRTVMSAAMSTAKLNLRRIFRTQKR